MSTIERYRKLYEYEKACNDKMLTMIESVPEANRSDPRFQQAVTLADHLAACRENWLTHLRGDGRDLVDWFDKSSDLSTLRPRYTALEAEWTDYLHSLDDTQLTQEFTFLEAGGQYSLPTEGQIMQLVGHALYHRGQIALLVDQLGGETVDSDYIYWAVRSRFSDPPLAYLRCLLSGNRLETDRNRIPHDAIKFLLSLLWKSRADGLGLVGAFATFAWFLGTIRGRLGGIRKVQVMK